MKEIKLVKPVKREELYNAIRNNNIEVTASLIERINNGIDYIESKNIHIAAMAGFIIRINDGIDNVESKPIHIAAGFGQIEILEMLIAKGANINAKNIHSLTPLHLAIRHKEPETTKILIEIGANVNAISNDRITPLMLAARYGNMQAAKLLIESGADINACDTPGQTALFYCATDNNIEVAQFLIKCGANVNMVNIDHITPLMLAARYGNMQAAKLLIESGADINACDRLGQTALFYCATNDNTKIAQFLIKCGANINIVDSQGNDIVDFALAINKTQFIKELNNEELNNEELNAKCDLKCDLKNKIDLNIKAIKKATAKGDENIELIDEMLSSCNININMPFDFEEFGKCSLLCHAAASGHKKLAELYVNKYGADINAYDTKGQTALFYCVLNNNIEVAQFLIECGASFNIINYDNQNLIDFATIKNQEKFIEILNNQYDLKNKIDLNIKAIREAIAKGDENIELIDEMLNSYKININMPLWPNFGGCSLLVYAAASGHKKLAELFIDKYGADLYQRNSMGFNAIKFAVENYKKEIFDLLVNKYHVDVNARDENGKNLLSRAIFTNIKAVDDLVNIYGADIYRQDKINISPIEYIGKSNILDINIIKMLVGNNRDNLITGSISAIIHNNKELVELFVQHYPYILIEKIIIKSTNTRANEDLKQFIRNKTDDFNIINELFEKDGFASSAAISNDRAVEEILKNAPTYENISVDELTSDKQQNHYKLYKTYFNELLQEKLNHAVQEDIEQVNNLLQILHDNMQKAGMFTKDIIKGTTTLTLAEFMFKDSPIAFIYQDGYESFVNSSIPPLKFIAAYKLAALATEKVDVEGKIMSDELSFLINKLYGMINKHEEDQNLMHNQQEISEEVAIAGLGSQDSST